MTASPHPGWWWARRVGGWIFFVLIAWLLVQLARDVDWHEVGDSLARMPLRSLLAAGAVAACSFAIYSTYDLLGRRMTGHRLAPHTVLGVTFISYAFNLNLGSLIGGIASRYRLYSRFGLDNETITRVLGFSILTNWLGYLAVAGTAFCLGSLALPPGWRIGSSSLRILGVALLLLAFGYLLLCATANQRVWRIRGQALRTPPLRVALLQLVLSGTNWCLIGGVVWLLLERQPAYPQVLAVLLAAAVAGVLTHVPAGLGVLEAVFVALLADQVPEGRLLAALLAYRAIYYLLPLAIAAVAYVFTEVRARQRRQRVGGRR